MSLKDKLTEAQSGLYALADEASAHTNQHFADLIRSAGDRLKDAIGHPDAEREPGDTGNHVDALNSGGNLLFAAGDPGAKVQAEEGARREMFARDAASRNTATGEPLPAGAFVPTREKLDAALAALPGDYTDPDYVVGSMRVHFGTIFTDADEKTARERVVKPQA